MGGGLNAIILVFFIWEITRNPNLTFGQNQLPFITTSPELTVIYIVIGILFSISTSLLFSPKRIVSTLYMQTTTATILITIITSYYYLQHFPSLDYSFFINESSIIAMFYLILGGVGWLQGWVVRRIIGVNGDQDNIDYQTHSINAKYEDVSKIVKSKAFLYNNNLLVKGKYTDRVILQTKHDAFEKHVLVLIQDPQNKDSSILAITSYIIKFDWLGKPKTPTEREGILGNLERLLQLDNTSINISSSNYDKVATNNAITQSLKITHSPFGELRNYSKRHAIVAGILITIEIILFAVHSFDDKIISNDTLVNSAIFLIIVFLIDVLPSIKEKIQSVKSD
jgi:hypothetical protein